MNKAKISSLRADAEPRRGVVIKEMRPILRKNCKKLFKKYHVPGHIVEHMQKTAEVSAFIAKRLIANKHKVNIELAYQAALLHDIVKLVDFKTIDLSYFSKPPTKADLEFWHKLIKKYHKYHHCGAGYKVLMAEKEPEIAIIVKKHCFNSLIHKDPNQRPITWEEKIVYYADKRVRFDKVVTLKTRLLDGQKRYFPNGDFPKTDKQVEKALFKLEKELCKAAGIKPEDIV